ncbi:MAG: hypothetical protein ISS23_03485 [Nanoarchaeota archaeon]|nr:hypothetical protein [Nanoarchaeota archaeon]
MAIDLRGGIEQLEEMGFFEYAVPFFLVFLLVWAILTRIKIFGEQGQRVNAILAAILGILLVRQGALVEFINTYLPNVSAVIIIFFGFLLLLGLFGFQSKSLKGGVMIFCMLLSLAGGIWALAQTTQGEAVILPVIDKEISESDAGAMVVVGVLILLIAIAGSRPKLRGLRGHEGFFDAMSKMGDKLSGG